MTFLQLEYIVRVARSGSLTKAAKELMITQSNLSLSIKAVEKEYGIKIFRRTQHGVEPTENGKEFITYARFILSSHKQMSEIGTQENHSDFSVVAMMTTFFNNAFIELCINHQNDKECNFTLIHQALLPALQSVEDEQFHLAAIVLSPSNKNRFHDLIKGRNMEAVFLGSVPVNVYLRKGHPLLADVSCPEQFPFTKLKNYPFIDYPQGGVRDMMLQEVYPTLPKGNTKRIEMPAYHIRDEIICKSNAYGIGADRSNEEMRSLVKIPIPGSEMEAYCCHLFKNTSPYVKEYIELVINDFSGIRSEQRGQN